MSGAAPALDRLQRWMQAAITHREGLEAGLASDEARAAIAAPPIGPEDLERVVLPSSEVSALERLRIYSNMYIWRLIDIHAEDFAALRSGPGLHRDNRSQRLLIHIHERCGRRGQTVYLPAPRRPSQNNF